MLFRLQKETFSGQLKWHTMTTSLPSGFGLFVAPPPCEWIFFFLLQSEWIFFFFFFMKRHFCVLPPAHLYQLWLVFIFLKWTAHIVTNCIKPRIRGTAPIWGNPIPPPLAVYEKHKTDYITLCCAWQRQTCSIFMSLRTTRLIVKTSAFQPEINNISPGKLAEPVYGRHDTTPALQR